MLSICWHWLAHGQQLLRHRPVWRSFRLGLPASAPGDERAAFFGSIGYGMALIFTGQDASQGARLVRRATAIMERSDSLYRSPQMVAWTGMGPLWLRENAAGRDLLYRAVDMAREQGAMGELSLALSPLALDSASSDRWLAAHAQFSEVIRLAHEAGQPALQCMGSGRPVPTRAPPGSNG